MKIFSKLHFQDPFNNMIWTKPIEGSTKSSRENTAQETTLDSGCQDAGEPEFWESSSAFECDNQTHDNGTLSYTGNNADLIDQFQNSSTLSDLFEDLKGKALTRLTNIEFWIHQFDKSFTSGRIKQALEDGWDDPELSESLITTFLDNMNTYLSSVYPAPGWPDCKKDFFPNLANILMKRLPIIFGDYLNKVDIENFNAAKEPNMQILDKAVNHERKPRSKKDKIPEEYLKMIGDTGHGKHSIDIRFNQRNSVVIFCDGYPFLLKSALASKPGVNNYYLRCADKTCKAFMKIRNGKIISYPRHQDHRNHSVWKASTLFKELRD